MPSNAKRYLDDRKKVDPQTAYPLSEAVDKVKSFSKPKFDPSVEICMHLGIDPRQADQIVRGSTSLPHGVGKSRRVIAFCAEEKVEAAKAAGAVEAGGDELVKKIEGGWMDFDVAVAEPPMMKVISKLGRTLGPRGLMPSPKAGTVTPDIEQAVQEYAAGKVEFRNDSGGNVHAVIGKQSFDKQQLQENAEFFINTIQKMRPSTTKGHYIRKVSLSATMSPGVTVAI
jgi:large subunit ribosomal protein L1